MKELKSHVILSKRRIFIFLAFSTCVSRFFFVTTKQPKSDDFINSTQCKNSGTAREFWVDRYVKWHSKARKDRAVRRLIFKACRSGIGDNLHGLIRTYAYAVLSHRVLLIEWNEPELMREIMDENSADQFLLNSTTFSYLNESEPIVLTWRDSFEKILPVFYGTEKDVYFTTGAGPYIRQHVVDEYETKCNTKLPKLDFKTSRKIIREILKPSSYFIGLKKTAQKKLQICGTQENNGDKSPCKNPYIALHARIGAGIGEGSIRRFKKLSKRQKSIAACIAYAVYAASKDLYQNPKTVFLATDTISFRETFRKELRGYGSDFKLKFLEGNITHIVDIHENKDDLKKRHCKALDPE